MTTSEHVPDPEQPRESTPPSPLPYIPNPPLRRSRDRILGGVVAGLAERGNIDTNLARLLAVLAFLFSAGTVAVAYAAAWILLPGPDSPAPISRWQRQMPAA